MACAAGHSKVAEILLDEGANVKVRSDTGMTCLHYLQAFEPDEVEKIAGRLLALGADIEAKDVNGDTPLNTACLMKQGREAIPAIEILIQHGANPMNLGSNGYSCFDIAAMNLDPNLLRALLNSPSLFDSERGVKARNSIRARALNKVLKIPKYHRLRQGGASRQSRTEDMLKLLISDDVVAAYIADSPSSHTPLHDACIGGCSDLLEPLLSFGSIHINQFADGGSENTVTLLPLFEALKHDHAEIVRILADHGADITLRDSANRNVLHFAVEYAPDLFNLFVTSLTQLDCDIQTFINEGTRQRGFTPFDIAIHTERFHLADILLRLGAQYKGLTRKGEAGELYTSLGSTAGSKRQMSYFLDMEGDKRPELVVCSNGFTLFHVMAASFDNALLETDPSPADNITFLLEHYVSQEVANWGDSENSTPLHVAVFSDNTSVAQTLLNIASADVNARNKFGRTPLDFLEARKANMGRGMKELHLVDDLEVRNWKRRNERMERLLKCHGAVAGAGLV